MVAPAAETGVIAPVQQEVGSLGQRLDMVTVLRLHHSLAVIPERVAAERLDLATRLRALDPSPA